MRPLASEQMPTYLLCLLGEGLQNVRLPGVVAIGVLQPLQNALAQHQHGDPELVPEELHCVDVHNHVDGVGQQLQGEFSLKEGMDLLNVIGNVFANVLQLKRKSINQSNQTMTTLPCPRKAAVKKGHLCLAPIIRASRSGKDMLESWLLFWFRNTVAGHIPGH